MSIPRAAGPHGAASPTASDLLPAKEYSAALRAKQAHRGCEPCGLAYDYYVSCASSCVFCPPVDFQV
jgi:hypothetical protein